MALVNFITFIIIRFNIELDLVSTYNVIGNYSRLNPNDCGISRFTPDLDISCFKWPTNQFTEMRNARNARNGEAPWVVRIIYLYTIVEKPFKLQTESSCTGFFISNQWILTAAHCLQHNNNPKEYRVFFGIKQTRYADPHLKVKKIYQHQSYSSDLTGDFFYDIGLLELENPLKSNDTIRSICLPERDTTIKRRDLALVAGWGVISETVSDDILPLQIGYSRILPSDDYSMPGSNLIFAEYTKQSNSFMCEGDSGGPLWRFEEHRAVVIGISKGIIYGGRNWTKCSQKGDRPQYMKVSKFIDWIVNITGYE